MAKILNVISATTLAGGTLNKLKILCHYSQHEYTIYFALSTKSCKYEETKKVFSDLGIPVFEGYYGKNYFKHLISISKIIRNRQIDVVHFYFNFETLLAPFIKILYPKIIQIRSFVGLQKQFSLLEKFILNTSYRSISNYIYISKYIKKQTEKTYPILKNKNSYIIYNCAVNYSANTCHKNREHLISVGGLNKSKNYPVIIQAMDIIIHTYKRNCKLYIVGEKGKGTLEYELRELIEQLSLEHYVILTGPTQNVIQYLETCKIYLHPADIEGFGIAVTEAMMMKCPCIVSNAGALPELIEDNQSGYVVDPYNPQIWAKKIIELLDNKLKREAMGEAAYLRANSLFPLLKFINKHDELYCNLTHKHSLL